MKRKTFATLLVLVFLVVLMIWSFGSSAANNRTSNAPSPAENVAPDQVFADEDQEADADLGKHAGRIDREEYLRARDEYIARKRGIEPGRPFNPELRSEAINQMGRQEKGRRLESLVMGGQAPPLAIGGAWTAIGPAPLPNGVGSATGPTSGRVTTIAIDPTSNGQKVYLGTAQGGVWRSLDGGTNWTAIFDNAQSLAIGALAIAPSNPSILYVGTGEFNQSGDSFFGVGLYRIDSVDTTPSLVGPINPQKTFNSLTYNVFEGRSITKILVHPTNPDIIFVSTGRGTSGSGANGKGTVPTIAQRGVFRSTNATSSAGIVDFEKLNIGGITDADTPDMVMEPGNPDNLIVASLGSGIYRTTNATAATPSFTQTLSLSGSIRVSLAINKVGSNVTAYAATSETPTVTPACATQSGSPAGGAIRKSTDGGATWSAQLAGGQGFCAGQCFYDMPIAVDPNDANVLFVGGQVNITVNGTPCGRLVGKSTDGANTSFAADSTSLHADDHVLVFDGAGNIFTGNDGGVWKKATASTTWTNLNNAPLNTLQFESIAVHPTDQFLIIGGTQDNGTEAQQNSPGNWIRAEGGDGGYSLIDQSATDTMNVTMYHTFYNNSSQMGFDRIFKTACIGTGSLFDSWPTRGAGTLGSTDSTPVACDGGTQLGAANGLVLTSTVLFYAPMALGPGKPNTVYFGADRLYRSNDQGDTMTAVSQIPLASPASPISTIAIWPGGDNVRVVGTQNGQVWATANGSSTLINVSPALPSNPTGSTTNKFIGRAMIDPNNKDVAYITLSYYAPAGQGIWKITNLSAAAVSGGATPNWVAAGNGIPSIPINAFAIDPQNSNNLYAGTDIGVYFSNDAGGSWAPYGSGLPRSAVFDLKIQPSSRLLRAATHGRGVWETALVNPAASTLQFSSPTMSITEGTGSSSVDATVTITRSGDTSFPASVNYATGDASGANGCSVNSGSASSRCDYIATSGTLNFAANETSKTITIPITYDSYVESPETFTVTLSAPGGLSAGLGSPSTITITITDSGFTGANQIDTPNFFVREHYVDFLNREPDASGLAFWTHQMTNCGPNDSVPADVTVCHVNVSGAFFQSIEFQQTGYLVERMYKVAFGDATGTSTTGGSHTLRVPFIRLNQFLPDTQRIGRGVIVGQGNWQQQLDDNKNAFSEEFVQRPAFLTVLPLSMTPAAFVDALNNNARDNSDVKPLSTSERDNLVNALTNGTMTRAQVVRAVAEDPDLANSEKSRAFVLMQYFGYMRRNPNDPQDSDYAGYEFWLGKLNQFNGDYVAAEMVKAFISADEYRHRFASN
jgi:hypothetical protein